MKTLALALVLLASACATSFTGDAFFPGGVASCRATCERDGMEMGGFVYSGEYSTSCICRARRAPSAQAPAGPLPPGWSAYATASADDDVDADLAPAVGVILEERRRILP